MTICSLVILLSQFYMCLNIFKPNKSWVPCRTYIVAGGGLVTMLCATLAIPWTVACQAPLSMGFSRQEYWSRLGCHLILQSIFLTQQSNRGLWHCRQILYKLSHKGSPRILGWVAYPFSSKSSQPRNWTRVSCIAGGFFTNWAIRKAIHKEVPKSLPAPSTMWSCRDKTAVIQDVDLHQILNLLAPWSWTSKTVRHKCI